MPGLGGAEVHYMIVCPAGTSSPALNRIQGFECRRRGLDHGSYDCVGLDVIIYSSNNDCIMNNGTYISYRPAEPPGPTVFCHSSSKLISSFSKRSRIFLAAASCLSGPNPPGCVASNCTISTHR